MVDTFDRGEKLTFDVDGTAVELSREDTLIEPMQKSGFMAESEGDLTEVLDTNLTPELIEDGFVREVISKIQTMRTEASSPAAKRRSAAPCWPRSWRWLCPPRTPMSRNGTSTAKTPCSPPARREVEQCAAAPVWGRRFPFARSPLLSAGKYCIMDAGKRAG